MPPQLPPIGIDRRVAVTLDCDSRDLFTSTVAIYHNGTAIPLATEILFPAPMLMSNYHLEAPWEIDRTEAGRCLSLRSLHMTFWGSGGSVLVRVEHANSTLCLHQSILTTTGGAWSKHILFPQGDRFVPDDGINVRIAAQVGTTGTPQTVGTTLGHVQVTATAVLYPLYYTRTANPQI